MESSKLEKIIDAILDNSIEDSNWKNFPFFDFLVPSSLKEINPDVLNPRNTWQDKEAYDKMLEKLANMFIENFKTYENTPSGKTLATFGPKV